MVLDIDVAGTLSGVPFFLKKVDLPFLLVAVNTHAKTATFTTPTL